MAYQISIKLTTFAHGFANLINKAFLVAFKLGSSSTKQARLKTALFSF